MNRMILVPIDISDTELTDRVIKHVEAEARIDDAEVHFLTVIPSLPYYASLGMAYTAQSRIGIAAERDCDKVYYSRRPCPFTRFGRLAKR